LREGRTRTGVLRREGGRWGPFKRKGGGDLLMTQRYKEKTWKVGLEVFYLKLHRKFGVKHESCEGGIKGGWGGNKDADPETNKGNKAPETGVRWQKNGKRLGEDSYGSGGG